MASVSDVQSSQSIQAQQVTDATRNLLGKAANGDNVIIGQNSNSAITDSAEELTMQLAARGGRKVGIESRDRKRVEQKKRVSEIEKARAITEVAEIDNLLVKLKNGQPLSEEEEQQLQRFKRDLPDDINDQALALLEAISEQLAKKGQQRGTTDESIDQLRTQLQDASSKEELVGSSYWDGCQKLLSQLTGVAKELEVQAGEYYKLPTELYDVLAKEYPANRLDDIITLKLKQWSSGLGQLGAPAIQQNPTALQVTITNIKSGEALRTINEDCAEAEQRTVQSCPVVTLKEAIQSKMLERMEASKAVKPPTEFQPSISAQQDTPLPPSHKVQHILTEVGRDVQEMQGRSRG